PAAQLRAPRPREPQRALERGALHAGEVHPRVPHAPEAALDRAERLGVLAADLGLLRGAKAQRGAALVREEGAELPAVGAERGESHVVALLHVGQRQREGPHRLVADHGVTMSRCALVVTSGFRSRWTYTSISFLTPNSGRYTPGSMVTRSPGISSRVS